MAVARTNPGATLRLVAAALIVGLAALVAWPSPRPAHALACTCSDPIDDFVCCKCHLVTPCPILDNTSEADDAIDESKALLKVADDTKKMQDTLDQLNSHCKPGPLGQAVTVDLSSIALAPRLARLPAIGKHA